MYAYIVLTDQVRLQGYNETPFMYHHVSSPTARVYNVRILKFLLLQS